MSITADATPRLAGALADVVTPTFVQRMMGQTPFPDRIPTRCYTEQISEAGMLGGRALVLSDPAAVKHVLLDNVANYPKHEMERRFFTALFGAGLLSIEGDLWRTHRRVMAPAFSPSSVASYAADMAGASEDFAARWAQQPDGQEIDASADMTELTLQIISRTMFSTDQLVDLIGRTMAQGFESQNFNILDILPVIGPARMKEREARMAALFRPLDDEIAKLIAAREGRLADGPQDLLARLVAAKDDETGQGLTAQEVRDEVITIFIAGHETTATAMGWLWYVLSQQPAEEARLHEELDRVLGGRTPTQEDLANLPYTRRVVDETMRLFPPAPGISNRVALESDEVGGHKVKPGDNMLVFPWVLHRHRDLWEDPERFDPDRFLPERSVGRHRFAYMPFGAGPRICIGQMMAVNEIILILATLAQKFRLELAPEADVKLKHNITLRPLHGLPMILRHRR
ncbi:MAG: cytochrome P450 [Caulobacteraceae bacterium]